MNSLPEWMRPQAASEDRLPSNIRRSGSSPLRRALGGFAHIIAGTVSTGAGYEQSGFLQRIDPRAKVIGLIGLIVVATLVHTLLALAVCYAGVIALAIASKVAAGRLARAWLMVPLFSAAIILPATLNIVTEGRHILPLWRSVAVTDAGLMIACRFILRTAVCVSLAMLLATTTRPDRLFRGLRALGVPKIFIMLLTMMERYLAVLARTAGEIHLAKISRSVALTSTRREQAWAAAGMGSLFRRTQSLGTAVHSAMLSRGWTGEPRLLDEPKLRPIDWTFLAICAGFASALILIGNI